MPEPLPNWVIDLVNELAEQVETHPRLLFESGAFEGTAPYEWCPCHAYALVPKDVRDRAAAIAAYRREAAKDKEPTDG